MKDSIKTAEEILKESTDAFEENSRLKYDVLDAMKEYAEQFIDLAAEEATANTTWYQSSGFVGKVNKESILKVKQLIK